MRTDGSPRAAGTWWVTKSTHGAAQPPTTTTTGHDAEIPLLAREGLFPPWLRWGFTTRHGGASTGAYSSLNLGWDVGDDRRHVRENHRRLGAALGYDPRMLATVHQVHGRHVHVVRTPDEARALRGRHGDGIVLAPRLRRADAREPRSGAVRDEPATDRRTLAALVRVADCCPVIVGALEHPVAAVLHCGWRSTVRGLIAEGIATIARVARDPRPALAAAIGPCIGPAAFEVGEDVALEFTRRVGPEVVLRGPGWRRPHVDLQAAIRCLLVRAGVSERRVFVVRRCSFGEPADFFSFRRDGHDGGRQAGVIRLSFASATAHAGR